MNEVKELDVVVNHVVGTSKKTGNPYTLVEIVFPDGYKLVIFPNNDQKKNLSTYL